MIDMTKEPIERLLTLAARGDAAAVAELEERDLCPPVVLTANERAELFLGITNSDTILGAGGRVDGKDSK